MKLTKPRKPGASSQAQLAALHASTTARRQATVERLQAAIDALHTKKQAVTTQSIYEECGLRYAAIHRNSDTLALFRANSTHLNAKKQRIRRQGGVKGEDAPVPSRDPLLNYKKPQIITRLRSAQQQILEQQQQMALLAENSVVLGARIAELEAKLAELEPYRTFVERIRSRVRQEEHGNNMLPPQM